MSAHLRAGIDGSKTGSRFAFTPAPAIALKRRCACGNHAFGEAECADCAKRQASRGGRRHQVRTASPNPSRFAPESDSPDLRYGDDFSRVPVGAARRALRAQTSASPPTQSPAEARDYEFMRSHFCLAAPDPSKPQRQPFTQRERAKALFGLWAARGIASRAFANLAHRDPYHLRMASRTFQTPVTFELLDQHVGRIRNVLNNLAIDQNLFAATCDDPDCNTGSKNAVAVTLDDLSAVKLCPFFFIQPARTLATTFLHEAGHMAGIDVNFTPGSERYCRPDDVIECDNICPLSGENLLENVDAWARFMYCVSTSG